ncbi:HoxN/HupN/NixA family nickel/cobalt transporter [Amycolatopsis saalfeldensis]|uniref:Nickel/cobalt efflux system n=1 Tax=Amycolatopsis saalfeldensis TaxID=394193 RepID=A0A1H8U6F9_9PSEU|nr:HoxN/HupN/NixA family nickel/cobalt transporter [Amycolatopsis saalfeldensis]SEO98751.1 high-affinity nickel-transport protein [Amycolatopsis saalfeldensis]
MSTIPNTVARQRLSRRERTSVAGMAAVVLLLNLLGWGLLGLVVAPRHYTLGATGFFGTGLGVTAFTLGMRHAFDADHIAAIDNTTRKLIAEGKRPLSVGFWFSLGHSTVVFLLCLLLSLGIRALAGQVTDGGSALHRTTGLIGTSVSGVFLYLIAILNLVVLKGILKALNGMREGKLDETALEQQLDKRGLLNRVLGGATKAIREPWHIYPVGVLFGLGFDTATEVGLLVLAAGAAAFALPWYAILVLPILFAAGMTLFDAADGFFMNFAYAWAFAKPARKIFYNLTITALSVAIALIVGTIELVALLVDEAGITSGPLAAIAGLSLDHVGFVIAGLFVATWLGALAVWHFGHIEAKWTTPKPARPGDQAESASGLPRTPRQRCGNGEDEPDVGLAQQHPAV